MKMMKQFAIQYVIFKATLSSSRKDITTLENPFLS